jgi:hypothetical protein
MPRLDAKLRGENYIEQAIVQLLSLKMKAGSSLVEVRQLVKECLTEVSLSAGAGPQFRGLGVHKLGSILRVWHTEPKYLAFDGLPRPLPTEGRQSLKALIRRFYPADKQSFVFERLVSTKLIRRHAADVWVPVGRSARIAQLSPESLEHVSAAIVRYMETVTRNVTAKREQDLLFERSCQVVDLPASEFDAFRKYIGQQAIAFLYAVDDWLVRRASLSKGRAARKCTAGVHAFAFMIENRSGKSSRVVLKSRSRRSSATHPSTPFSKSSPHSSSANRS